MTERIRIELGEVQKTLLIPLWGRAKEWERPRPLVREAFARDLVARLDFDFEAVYSGMPAQFLINGAVRAFHSMRPCAVSPPPIRMLPSSISARAWIRPSSGWTMGPSPGTISIFPIPWICAIDLVEEYPFYSRIDPADIEDEKLRSQIKAVAAWNWMKMAHLKFR